MPRSETARLTVAIFGAMSALGNELRRLLEEEPIGLARLSLYETQARQGSLAEFEGEAVVVTTPDEEEAARADVAFICGEDDPSSAQYLDWIARGEGAAIDLVGAAGSREGVPMINCDVNPEALQPGLRLIASPHAIAQPLSTLLHGLGGSFHVTDVCATVLRPVSDGGKRAVEELHQQTIGVLRFSPLPTDVFGRQMAFNLLPVSVQGDEGRMLERIVRADVGRVLGETCPPLSLKILQVPVFYGHCYLLRVRMEEPAAPADVVEALDRSGLFHISRDPLERTPVELATQTGIWVAEVSGDEDQPGAFWLWIVTDALRSGAARNAAQIARRLVEAGR